MNQKPYQWFDLNCHCVHCDWARKIARELDAPEPKNWKRIAELLEAQP